MGIISEFRNRINWLGSSFQKTDERVMEGPAVPQNDGYRRSVTSTSNKKQLFAKGLFFGGGFGLIVASGIFLPTPFNVFGICSGLGIMAMSSKLN